MDKAALAALGQNLREGQRVRVSHGCGDGRTMLVSREGGSVRGWCFRCNEGLYADLDLSIQDNLFRVRQSLRLAADEEHASAVEYPGPLLGFEQWPPAARLWLLRAGMGGDACARMDAGWHEGMHRVVLPLFDAEGVRRSWTARAVDDRTPKYLTGHLPAGFVAELVANQAAAPMGPVVVEDWLSANKLHAAGAHVVCMLGTYPKPATLARLLQFEEVLIWLDNDLPPKHRINYGQVMARRVARTIRAYGVRVRNIASERDPKLLGVQEVRALIATARTTSASVQDGGFQHERT